MIESRQCPSCGCELHPDSLSGLCPECLLSAGLTADNVNDREAGLDNVLTPQPGIFVPPKPDSLAAHFPQLEILESLGHGGMGAVYKARQTKLDRMVALKILRPESADDPEFAERFNREARTLARLHHPNIVAIHDFGEVTLSSIDSVTGKPGRLFYILMEYVDGANLRQLLQADDLQPDQTLVIAAQVCEALQFAHDEHVVHRDIKPENILVDSRGRVKIADFGLAKLTARSRDDFTLTGTHQIMGTPRYMSPEQMDGSQLVDHRADIYSLGVVLYEMLTGQVPAGHFEPPSRMARVDSRLDQIVLRALAREPQRRYQNVSDLKADVVTVAGSSVMHSLEQVASGVAQAAGTPTEHNMTEHDYEMLRLEARGPAGGLILVGALSAGFWFVMGMFMLLGSHMRDSEEFGIAGGVTAAVLAGCFLVFGGLRLRNLLAYELCVAASILVILPWSPAAVLGIPVGIWCLRTLQRADIKAA
ncbi:MAG: protein kinase, partial [Planctomycetaceae bacterium]|nr:protein kinase [Planctomycetaceae bacterium]